MGHSKFRIHHSPAWVQHFIHHLAPQGMAGFVLAFETRHTMQSFVSHIAWESEV